jgi:multidrug efflux pump subunit AcrB
MWIVQIALKRPYTFVVLAIVIVLFGVLAATTTPIDIFPSIGIPVIAIVWSYTGLVPIDMSGRVTYFYERVLTAEVNNIQSIDSQSVNSYSIIKVYFQPHTDVALALGQITAISQTILKLMPAGMTPPIVLQFDAASVPVIQLTLSGRNVDEAKLFDYGNNFLRPALATVQGAQIVTPMGGKYRQVQSDLNLQAMQQFGVSAQDVVNALKNQNLIIPAGTEKIGKFEWYVTTNASPLLIDQLNAVPVKVVNGTVIYLRDVAYTHDGNPPQLNIVRVNGARAVLMPVEKIGNVSTLDVISETKATLPRIEQTVPKGIEIHAVGDQSVFVKAAVDGVIHEGIIAAALTALMILLFLGSWRSTLIIAISIPLSVLSSIIVLSAIGETINTMTLGGLALAVGMLVDEATVTIENINYHLEMGKDIETAILDGAQQIVIPAFLSLLSISIVFVPMFALGGVAGYLFRPMAEAVVFAMTASFILSRTLVPTMAMYLLAHEHKGHGEGEEGDSHKPSRNPFVRFQRGFERRFEAMRHAYRNALAGFLTHRGRFVAIFMGGVVVSWMLAPFLGRNFFPYVDAGSMYLHVSAQTGTRVEETARLIDEIDNVIRTRLIPADEIDSIVDNIGLPISLTALAYLNTGTIGPQDVNTLITLKPNHKPTPMYMRRLRRELPRLFPGVKFSFLPADIVSQILNFGSPAPIDIKIAGQDEDAVYAYAAELMKRFARVPGVVDLRLQQPRNYPTIRVDTDRTLAGLVGLTAGDVANSLLTDLYGSFQVAPNFWLNYDNNVEYQVSAQVPQYRIQNLSDLANLPMTSVASPDPSDVSRAAGAAGVQGQLAAPRNPVDQNLGYQILGALSRFNLYGSQAVVSHFNVQPEVDIYLANQDRDLGAVADDVQRVLDETKKDIPRGGFVLFRGLVTTMQEAYGQLSFGLIGSIVLIYLLLVVNFQSWLDPFIIITALPAALAGIVWMLFTTHTTLSVPALTGAIMCMGVATANSILVVSFAREKLAEGLDSVNAALEAGFVRLRPVLMTASAMIIGMVPMSLGLGAGGEQNAPLGRAVIGGLVFATVSTLFFVPAVFSIMHRNANKEQTEAQ